MTGTLVVNGTHSGPVALFNGATLAGTGSLGDVTAVDGVVSPGGDGTGIMRATQLLMGTNDVFLVHINGTTQAPNTTGST